MKNILFALALAASAQAQAITVAIDSGHTPSSPGVRGSCGAREVDYNDQVTRLLVNELQKDGYQVRLTRPFGKEVLQNDRGNGTGRESAQSLRQRVVNAGNSQILISIHHDSTAEAQMETVPGLCEGNKPGTRFKDSFKNHRDVKIGFNVFVSGSRSSNRLGLEIGKRLRALGLEASNYHSERWEPGQGATPIDEENGLWQKGLFIVRQSPMPAILIEIHPIVDPDYEAYSTTKEFREAVTKAIKEGVDAYFGQP